ncbi:MAG: hypothetical protein HKN23_06415 [Verrucomicrobiales bacterium]|nr:hypothetical protein [Verrucomicrobiales bacterium]
MGVLRFLYRVFSSYALAATVLVLLTVITLFGTLDQTQIGLWGAKQKYFYPWFVWQEIGPIRLPIFPGGMLLMGILFINMSIGALVHVKKRWQGIPMLIAHFGILFLLVSGFVTHLKTRDGYIAIYPGQVSNRAESYREWQIEVLELGENDEPNRAHVVPWEAINGIGENGSRTIRSENLPFTLEVSRFLRNARPIPASAPMAADAEGEAIDGYKLFKMKRIYSQEEANVPACYVEIQPKGEGEDKKVILSGVSHLIDPRDESLAHTFEMSGKRWGLRLVKKSWQIGFHIRLDRFIFEKHPGTTKAKNFESRITRLDSHDAEDGPRVAVRMNEPMRHDGWVVFQERYGTSDTGPDPEYYSQFAISDNPADHWPLYSLYVITAGLLLHLILKLVLGLVRAGNRARRKSGTKGETDAPPIPQS